MAHQKKARVEREISPERLRELITYNAETGEMKWRPRAMPHHFNSRFAGRPALAGGDGDGYCHGAVLGMTVKAHRAAFCLHYGRWPDGDVDHANGDRSDNRISNLRETTRAGNATNRARSSANTSGATGVVWLKRARRWKAQIKINGKTRHLGQFEDYTMAVQARRSAETRLGFSPRHGCERGYHT